MKSNFIDQAKRLLKQSRPKHPIQHKIEFKNVFGAVGCYVNGYIFATCGKFGFALKLPPKALNDVFKETGVKHLKYFPKGHIKKEYAVLPNRILENRRKLSKLVDESVKYALSF